MERNGMHHIALVLDVAKWKPPKPGCLGFDASIYALHTECDPNDSYSCFEVKVASRVVLTGDAQLATDDVDPERTPKDRRLLKLPCPIMIGRFDSFAPKIGWIAPPKPMDSARIQEIVGEELAGELVASGVLEEPSPPVEPAKLFLHMDAMFKQLPTDGELEAQGFVRDHPRETHYGA